MKAILLLGIVFLQTNLSLSNEITLDPIPQSKTGQALNTLALRMNSSDPDFVQWATPMVWRLIEKNSTRLIRQNKIFPLTAEVRKAYKLDKRYCQKEGQNCTPMNAFYLPGKDLIFIADDVPEKRFAYLLFHEFIHAFHYHYRFFLDLAFLEKHINSENPYITKEEAFDFLNFFYETQAHWYRLTLEREGNTPWWDFAHEITVRESVSLRQKIPMRLSPLSSREDEYQHIYPSMYIMLRYIPTSVEKYFTSGNYSYLGRVAFKIPEMMVYEIPKLEDWNRTKKMDHFDWTTHHHYAHQLEKAQFQKLSFLSKKRVLRSQELIKQLHDNFNQTFNSKSFKRECSLFLMNFQTGLKSPVNIWLNHPEKGFKYCNAFNHLSSKQYRRDLFKLFMSGAKTQKGSPFYIPHIHIEKSMDGRSTKYGSIVLGGNESDTLGYRSGHGSNPEIPLLPEESDEIQYSGHGSNPELPVLPEESDEFHYSGHGSNPEVLILPDSILYPQVEVTP